MEPRELLLGNVIVRLLGLQALATAELLLLCERIKTIPGLPAGFFDGIMSHDPVVEGWLDKASDRVLYETLRHFGAALRREAEAPDSVGFSSLADELEEYATRFDPVKGTTPGPSGSPSKLEEEWLRRVLASLDPPDPPPAPQA